MNGFWGARFEKTFVDVRVFNPYAPSNSNTTITSCYKKHENQKKRAYDQRIREVEHATFIPLVLSATGGLSRQATVFYKRLASLLSSKTNQPYSQTMNWLRCRLSFVLLRSAIQCIRGARSSQGRAITTPQIDLATSDRSRHSATNLFKLTLFIYMSTCACFIILKKIYNNNYYLATTQLLSH